MKPGVKVLLFVSVYTCVTAASPRPGYSEKYATTTPIDSIDVEPKGAGFQTFIPDPGNFDGWRIGFTADDIWEIIDGERTSDGNPRLRSKDVSGFTVVPDVEIVEGNFGGLAPSGTTSLFLASSLSQVGFSSWTLDSSHLIELGGGNVYRLSLNIESDSAISGSDLMIRFGDALSTGNAMATFTRLYPFHKGGQARSYPVLGGTVFGPISIYLNAKSDGRANITGMVIDNEYTGGEDFTLHGYSIDVIPREEFMSGALPILNMGGEVPELADGETVGLPPDGETPFTAPPTEPSIPLEHTFAFSDGLNKEMPSSVTVADGKVLFQTGPSPTALHWEYTSFGLHVANPFNIDTLDTGLELDPTKLYLLDVYMSTDNPDVVQPAPVVSAQMDGLYGNHTTWISLFRAPINPPTTRLATEPRVYTSVINPAHTPNATARTALTFSMLHTIDLSIPGTTITIHRVVLYETTMQP